MKSGYQSDLERKHYEHPARQPCKRSLCHYRQPHVTYHFEYRYSSSCYFWPLTQFQPIDFCERRCTFRLGCVCLFMDELMISKANQSVSRRKVPRSAIWKDVFSSISCWNNTFIQGEKTLHLAVSAANCWHLWFWWKKHIIPIPTTYIKIWILKSPLFWESWNFTFEMSLQSYLDQNLIGRISIPSSWPERPSARALQPYAWEGWTNTTKDDDYPTIQRVLTIPGWCRILSINIINSISSFVAMIVQVWMGRDWYIIKSGLKAGIDGFIWEDSRLLCFMPQNSTLIEFQQLLFSFQLMFPLHQFTRWFQPGTKKAHL